MRLRHELSLEMWQCEISSRVMTNRRSVGAVVDIMEVAFTSQLWAGERGIQVTEIKSPHRL